MNGGVKLDMRAFNAGMRRKLAVTKRAVPVVVNQASKNVCLRAIAFTPKADPKQIEAQLTQNGFVFRLLQSKSFQARLPRKLQGFTRGTHSRAQINEAARQLVALRRRSVAYIKAGWIRAAQAFGGATSQQVSNRSLAGKGYGKRATESHPQAEGVNFARGASTVGAEALQQAVNFVGKDMADYAEKKLAAPWK